MRKKITIAAVCGLLISLISTPAAHADTAGSGACAITVTSAAGVVVVNNGTYCYLAFTATGSNAFTVPSGVTTTDLLIIAGGGAGGSFAFGGGGGAGELAVASGYLVTASSSISISVGAGGTSNGSASGSRSSSGSNSWVGSSTGVVAAGGGFGTSHGQNTVSSGGSGGGGSEAVPAPRNGGASVKSTFGTASRYGNAGGFITDTMNQAGSGGGGAGAAGGAVSTFGTPAAGGSGTNAVAAWLSALTSGMTAITDWGTVTSGGFITGGGGGGGNSYNGAAGGAGGGGRGGNITGNGIAGVTNTGSGGGGATHGPGGSGGAGGSGLVVVRYLLPPSLSSITISASSTNTFRTSSNITATLGVAGSDGKVTFYQNGKKIGGCINVRSSSLAATCNWRPSTRGSIRLYATLTPTSSSVTSSISPAIQANVGSRSNRR